jgi:hypothetical protein
MQESGGRLAEHGSVGASDSAPARREIFVETWSADYGSPLQIDESNEENGTGELIESEGFDFLAPVKGLAERPIAFVDGVRHGEAPLSQWIDGVNVPGLAGSYAVGAVLALPQQPPVYAREVTDRVVIWSAGQTGALPEVAGGWRWRTVSTADVGPAAPLKELQEMMRRAEGALADILAAEGYRVLLDGTLWFKSEYSKKNIAGYVKTHHVRLLPEAEAKRLPDLPAGYRTTLFRTDANRYACYLRLTDRAPRHAPMSGIVRFEFSGKLPLDEVRVMADEFAAVVPHYAGVLHIDPRAPQNLQPIGALERHLRHLIGDKRFAERAVRDAVALLFE